MASSLFGQMYAREIKFIQAANEIITHYRNTNRTAFEVFRTVGGEVKNCPVRMLSIGLDQDSEDFGKISIQYVDGSPDDKHELATEQDLKLISQKAEQLRVAAYKEAGRPVPAKKSTRRR